MLPTVKFICKQSPPDLLTYKSAYTTYALTSPLMVRWRQKQKNEQKSLKINDYRGSDGHIGQLLRAKAFNNWAKIGRKL